MKLRDQVASRDMTVDREIALLREELWAQWEANHAEHCGKPWPHPNGDRCHWPLPSVLSGDVDRSGILS